MVAITPAGVAAGAQALSAVTGLAGAAGLFGKDDTGGNVRVEPFTRQTWRESMDFAKRQHYMGIQDRVADAKAAGLHPLFALGASTGGTAIPSAGQFASGSARGDVTRRVAMAQQAFNQASQLAASQIRKTDAETDLINSMAKRAESPATPGVVPGVSEVTEPVVPSRPFWKQVMKSEGALSVPEPEERFFGWLAEHARDTARRGQARRGARWHRKEMEAFRRARTRGAARQQYQRRSPKRNWYDLY